jgi:hypothetical protein
MSIWERNTHLQKSSSVCIEIEGNKNRNHTDALSDGDNTDAVNIEGFAYGFRVSAAIDSVGNAYFREGFRYFFYQNIHEGLKSRRQITGENR